MTQRRDSFLQMRISPWGLLNAAGFLAVLGSLAGFFGRYAWWLDLGSHFRLQYAILFSVLGLLYCFGKRGWWALLCFGMAVLNGFPIATFLWPRVSIPASHGTPI